ncbi:hypothetical protein IFM61606_00678 [Aspergillus udagawae]|uniref:Uncharacterized protein n=1 Tax=Aspergillus udagawae TaxID=91492 RepID=A0A8E0UXQ3_9EURO|nr:uncharacterized protein Aud_006137 [Aspergillus udagawae]GFG20626.1 hypothetical protein IFM61606_00678 [Aspergillus udagawae]GIC89712.1 hypothetical protein Aud_006137 [Aspergillus udagawae]
MRFTTLLLGIFPAALMASPLETNVMDVEASNVDVTAKFWGGDLCDGPVDSISLVGSGSYRCVAVTNKRSISVPSMNGCTVKTWSGNNCRGSSFKVPDTGCHSVLYAGVSIQC